MTIDVLLTEEVFRRFTVFDILRRRKAWRPPVTFAAIMGISAIICYVMHHVKGAVFLGNVLMIIGLGMPVVYFTTFFASLRKQVLSSGLTRPQHVYTITLTSDADGIRADNGREHMNYPWKKIHHAYRDLTATYLFITAERAFILPHTCVEDPEAMWTLIQENMPKGRCTVLK